MLAGYYYHAPSGYYYDANSGLYFDSSDQKWKTYDEPSGHYVAIEGQADPNADPSSGVLSTGRYSILGANRFAMASELRILRPLTMEFCALARSA